MLRTELEKYVGELLDVSAYRDYAPNGLQIEGKAQISRIVTGVTASLALVEAALEHKADALIVHHGYFWKNENPCITRTKKARIAKLLAADLNLFAYHLPLDAHAELGNNAQLGRLLDLTAHRFFGEQNLCSIGQLNQPLSLQDFALRVENALQRPPLVIGEVNKPIQQVAWCTGGAQSYFHEAVERGIDCFITGEASEFVTHLANETGVAFIAAGHHATERYGVRALGQHLAQQFGVEHVHIDLPNPV